MHSDSFPGLSGSLIKGLKGNKILSGLDKSDQCRVFVLTDSARKRQ